jgi:branched-chain amino acid transport system permease protein
MAGPYFTLGTLAVGVVFLLVWLLPVLEEPIPLIGFPGSGGLQGLAVDPISNNQLLVYFIVLGFTVLSLAVMILIGKSKMGTIFKAIRDDDMGAKASGINIVKYKMIALMISAFFAGIAGALLAQKSGGASTSTFSATYSFLPIILVMMGGLTTISGSALGAFIYVVYDNIVPYIKTIPVIAANQVALDFVVASPTLIFAVILMLVIRFAPDGLLNPMFNKLQKAWDLMAGK